MKSRVKASLLRHQRVVTASGLLMLSHWTAVCWACDPNNIKHVPCPASSQAHQPVVYTSAKKPAIGPVSPGPLGAASSTAGASNPRGIIFVGGRPGNDKAALNPQPIPPGHGNGKAALNPQPIPPGKTLPANPPKWDVTKNKRS